MNISFFKPFLSLPLIMALYACGSQSSETPSTYAVSASISGYQDTGLVLKASVGKTLADAVNTYVPVTSDKSTVQVLSGLPNGAVWSVSVGTQPSTQKCSVANAAGTIAGANNANVVVTCAYNAYTVGGSVSGLSADGLVLANGADTITLAKGATSFTMPAKVAQTSSYNITVQTQPSGVACSVSNGQGSMGGAAVTNVSVSCTNKPFNLGGSITNNGPASSSIAGLTVLETSGGGGPYVATAGATSYTMPAKVAYSSSYALQIVQQPNDTGLTCSIANAAGTMGATDVSNANITCSAKSYELGGSVTGLASGGSVVLTNGTDSVTVTANGAFSFTNKIAYGGAYSVAVGIPPPTGQTCSVANGSATMGSSNVSNVAVTCSNKTYTVGGTISGLTGSGLVLQNNAADDLSVAANATSFTMPTAVAYLGSYAITVKTQPTGQTCTVTSGSGTVSSATDLSSVSIACVVTPTSVSKLPDTGTTSSQCYAAGSSTLVSCTDAAAIALSDTQDGMVGRDVTNSDNADGKLGFSYSTVGTYALTECVKDNITGLTWEGKPASGTRGGLDPNGIFANIGDSSVGDSSTYVAAVNSASLCGYTDWRLPTAKELQTIVDYGAPNTVNSIVADWFPNLANVNNSSFWTSSYAINPISAWYVEFTSGSISKIGSNSRCYVRLVR